MRLPSKISDLSKWYERIIYLADIASPGLAKGTLFIHARGWHIWENIQEFLDKEFADLNIRNVSFPSLIPILEIEKEKHELHGFDPELYYVSKDRKYSESSLFLRPTSEILFSVFFKRILNSHNQLPLLFNQWCNVYRLEKNTKAFLRNCEFYWQEVHGIFKTEDSAVDYVHKIHESYKRLVKNLLNLAILEGEKTINERFPGANLTLTLEAVMPDGQCLQIATSHYLSKNFSSIFEIQYSNDRNTLENPYQISAGTSTRLIGAVILNHGDDKGLILPLGVSDYQIKVLVLDKVVSENDSWFRIIEDKLSKYSIFWDFSYQSFGQKISNAELEGIPFVIVIGKEEISSNSVTIKSRIQDVKEIVLIEDLEDYFVTSMNKYSEDLYEKSSNNLKLNIVQVSSLHEAKKEVLDNHKVVLVPWFDDLENEKSFKSLNLGFGPRCIHKRLNKIVDIKCFYSGKIANSYAYFGRSY